MLGEAQVCSEVEIDLHTALYLAIDISRPRIRQEEFGTRRQARASFSRTEIFPPAPILGQTFPISQQHDPFSKPCSAHPAFPTPPAPMCLRRHATTDWLEGRVWRRGLVSPLKRQVSSEALNVSLRAILAVVYADLQRPPRPLASIACEYCAADRRLCRKIRLNPGEGRTEVMVAL